MTALFFLLPLLIFGGLVWGIVAAVRRPAGEPFSVITAISAYAHLFIVVGALMAMTGAATAIKAGLGYANLSFSYETGRPYGPTIADRQHDRADDLVQGLTLLIVGAGVVAGHTAIARAVRRRRAGSPGWIVRGTPLILALITAVGGLTAAAAGIYELLSYALLAPPGGRGPQPFGNQIGYALAFLPVWLVTVVWLLRGMRGGSGDGNTALPATAERRHDRGDDTRPTPGSIY